MNNRILKIIDWVYLVCILLIVCASLLPVPMTGTGGRDLTQGLGLLSFYVMMGSFVVMEISAVIYFFYALMHRESLSRLDWTMFVVTILFFALQILGPMFAAG